MTTTSSTRRAPVRQITPEILIDWYRNILDNMPYPEGVRPYIEDFDLLQIQNLIVYGEEMRPPGTPHDRDIDAVRNAEDIYHTLRRIAHLLQGGICHWTGRKKIQSLEDIVLNEAQFAALKKGYVPGWECRYATYYASPNFYLYRSGVILNKFRYRRLPDGPYHMTALYASPMAPDASTLRETLATGYWEVSMVERRGR